MSRCAVCVYGGGSLASTFSVNPSCRADSGILLILGRSWGMSPTVSVEDFSYRDNCREGFVGTGWNV